MAVNGAMDAPRHAASRRSPALPLAAVVLCHAALVAADTHGGSFPVMARVLPVARLVAVASPAGFTVTPDDVRRGYVNVVEPVRLQVASNSRAGFQLDVHNLAQDIPSLHLEGLGAPVDLPGEGGTVVQRWSAPSQAAVTLRFTFRLNEAIAPGSYPWPVQLGVRPL